MDIFDFFSEHGIAYERIDHEPVLTTEDSERVSAGQEPVGELISASPRGACEQI